MTSTKSPQLSVVYDFLRITRKLDRAELAELMHSSFEYRQLPSSLAKARGNEEPKGKEEFLDMALSRIDKYFKSFQYVVQDVNESPGKVWLHLTADAELFSGDAYKGESIYMINLISGDHDGTPKITSCKQFLEN